MDIYKDDACRGKVVFVAGGSSGINLGIAQRFAALGACVGLISRKQDRVSAAAASIVEMGGRAVGIEADVRDYEAVEQALKQVRDAFGEIDVTISGAAGNFLAPVVGMSANAFKTVIDIDLLGTFNVLRACYAYVRKPGACLSSITAGRGCVRPCSRRMPALRRRASIISPRRWPWSGDLPESA